MTIVPARPAAILAIVAGLALPAAPPWAIDPTCAIQAETDVDVGPGSRIEGDVAATTPGGRVRVGRAAWVENGTVVLGGLVQLGPGASVADVETNEVKTSRNSTIRGTQTPATLPVLDPACDVPAIECGGEPVSVAKRRTRTLPPGRYGSVAVGPGGTLVLAAGRYELCDLTVGRRGAVEAAGAATSVGIEGTLRAGGGTHIGPTGADGLPTFDVGGRVRLSTRARVEARLSAPAASLAVGPGSKLSGRFCAAEVHLSRRVELECPTGGSTTTTTAPPASSTSTSSSTTSSSTLPSTTTTSTSSSTTTSVPTSCGNGTIDPGETCDDGNLSDDDPCPSDCVVEACTPVVGGTLVRAVLAFQSPGVPIAGFEILIDYPEGKLDYANATPLVSGFFPPQDFGHALFVVRASATGIPSGDVLRTGYDACSGAPAPTNGDFGCEVRLAVDAGTTPVEGVTCTVTLE